jgi:hypothetical protein
MNAEPVSPFQTAGLPAQLAQGSAALASWARGTPWASRVPAIPRHNAGLLVRGALRRIPATVAYVGLLAVVAALMPRLEPGAASRLVQAASTNLDNLGDGNVSTLLTSAFVVTDAPSASFWILLAAVMTGLELLWGSWRAVAVFLAGHIGATLVVAAGLAVAVSNGWASPEVASAADVGASYGLMGLVGAVTAVLPPAVRPLWALAWLISAAGSIVETGGFTSAGHACALVIGLAIAVVVLVRSRFTTIPVPAMSRIAS